MTLVLSLAYCAIQFLAFYVLPNLAYSDVTLLAYFVERYLAQEEQKGQVHTLDEFFDSAKSVDPYVLVTTCWGPGVWPTAYGAR